MSSSRARRRPSTSSCGLDTDATGTRRQRLAAAFTALEAHEQTLRTQLDKGLTALRGVQVHSKAADRTPTVLLTFEDRPSAEAYSFLAERDVHAPTGSFYAIEASRRLGLGDTGGLRVGLAPYNSAEDIDRFLAGLAEFLAL